MVTDTAFRKSSLENILLKKVVPGTSTYWLYHTGLLVFCLRFKLLSVCKYFNNNDYFKSYKGSWYIYIYIYIYILDR